MATLKLSTAINNTTTSSNLAVNSLTVTQAGDYKDSGIVAIATSETTHTINTDIGNVGVCMFINRDATNYIDVGVATAVYPFRLKPGEAAIVRLAPTTSTIYALANTAACDLEYLIYED